MYFIKDNSWIGFFVKWQGAGEIWFRQLAGYRAHFFGKYFRPKAVAPAPYVGTEKFVGRGRRKSVIGWGGGKIRLQGGGTFRKMPENNDFAQKFTIF